MSTIDLTSETTIQAPDTAPVDFKLEVVILPVSDIARAKSFYTSLDWRLDGEFPIREDFHVVHFTPTGSQASILFGSGVTSAAPGSAINLLAVSDIEAARADLTARGVDVSEVFHGASGFDLATEGRENGPDPDRRSYASWASFNDPDGNRWLLQELTTRLPGR